MGAYRKRLTGSDRKARIEAARRPGACGKARPSRCCPNRRSATRSPRTISPWRLPASRTISSSHAGWMEEGQLLRDAASCRHPRRHRAWPLRHAVPGALRLAAAQGLAGGRVPPGRRAPAMPSPNPACTRPADLATDEFGAVGVRRAASEVPHHEGTPLSVRHDAARRRADQRRRLFARGQDRQFAGMLDRARHRLCRGRLSRRQPDRHCLLRGEADERPSSPPSA